MSTPLPVLVVDDEQPVLDELVYLLRLDERIGAVHAAASGEDALRSLEVDPVGAVFLDIAMPGLTGLDLARVLAQFRAAPRVIFVTAHEDHAVEAFELNAVDFLLKPIREERLRESIRRVLEIGARVEQPTDETIPVELGGVTRFVSRSDVAYAEAHGDYVRLHTVTGDAHLIRSLLGTLESDWAAAGFLRIHRSLLVSTTHVLQVRVHSGRSSVLVRNGPTGPTELQVARRHAPELRDLLQRRAGRA